MFNFVAALWGCHRIADELKKLGIELNPTTVNRIIQRYRKEGKIRPNGSWKKFLKSRMIIRFDITENPCREFVKQRIELFSEEFPGQKTMIHDKVLGKSLLGIKPQYLEKSGLSPFLEVCISIITEAAPNSIKSQSTG